MLQVRLPAAEVEKGAGNLKRNVLLRIAVLAMLALLMLMTGCGPDADEALADEIIWTNNNIAAVQNGPESDTVIVLEQDSVVTAIMDYHYFNEGAKPGTIGLIGEDGKEYGPWQATGRKGQGGVENAYWDTFPNIQLKAGEYKVVDSDPETWSQNDESGNAGFTEVRGKAAGN